MIENGSYCLNLHRDYAPTWGAWECAREIYANARDASADDMYIDSPNGNTLVIRTSTVPDLAELFVIGCGSKDSQSDSIGQFGEGLKITALAATRVSPDALTLRLPNHTVSFQFKQHLGHDVLFAEVADADHQDGYTATLKLQGVGYVLNGKVIDGSESRLLEKPEGQPAQIFCKGIWIMTLSEDCTLFSYNLNNITLNRDRSHADPATIKSEVGRVLVQSLTPTIAKQLFLHTDSWEVQNTLNGQWYSMAAETKAMFAEAFRTIHGQNSIIATSQSLATRCRGLGVKAVLVPKIIEYILSEVVETDEQFLARSQKASPVEIREEWRPMLAGLDRLARIAEVTDYEVRVFSDRFAGLEGQADMAARVIWLNERLMHRDNRFELIRTFLHELGHLHNNGDDATEMFENSLDCILGYLGSHILETSQ